MFEIGAEYTRDEIHAQYGGSKQTYLPTVSVGVVAVCIKPDLNPLAPQIILCGKGPLIAATGALLANKPAQFLFLLSVASSVGSIAD